MSGPVTPFERMQCGSTKYGTTRPSTSTTGAATTSELASTCKRLESAMGASRFVSREKAGGRTESVSRRRNGSLLSFIPGDPLTLRYRPLLYIASETSFFGSSLPVSSLALHHFCISPPRDRDGLVFFVKCAANRGCSAFSSSNAITPARFVRGATHETTVTP